MKPAAKRGPARVDSTASLRAFQRTMLGALVRPLGPGDGPPRLSADGRPMDEVASEFIRPNARLTALERLEIYHRMYWYRLLDCVADDSPGLASLLGPRRFDLLARAYLAKYPSRSFTLRNLCSRMPQFIREEPRWTAPRTALAHDIARFEWAQTLAYDGEERPLLEPAEIARARPARLKLGLQPTLSLLALDYPADAFVVAVKRRNALRDEASNARGSGAAGGRPPRKVAPPRRRRVYLAVFRVAGALRYERLEPAAFKILQALQSGRTLGDAIAAGGPSTGSGLRGAAAAQDWFATWMKYGWFCRRQAKGPKGRP